MSSESELLQSDQQDEPIDINALVEQLTELEVKTESAIDDEFDDKPLFFKKKKEMGTQTPGGNVHSGPSTHLTEGIHHKPIEHHHMNHPAGGGTNLSIGMSMSSTSLSQGHGRKTSIVIPHQGGNEKATHGQIGHEHKGVEQMSMVGRESRFGIPGVENSGAGAFMKKHRASILKMGRQTLNEGGSENDKSPPKDASKKPKFSLRGFLQKFGKGEPATPAKVSLFGNMDASTVADIEDKLSRAREIQKKGIELEMRCETLEKQEADMAKRLQEAQDEMERMRTKYANMDELIEEKYRQYVLEQQMMMQLRKKRAGGSQWLENMSEMDRKAEEKRMIMKMRAASHAKKRADARAAEEAAAEEKRRQIEKEKEDTLNYDSDEDDKKRKKNFRPKLNKLHAKGEHQKTKSDLKATVTKRDIKQLNNQPETTTISVDRLKGLLAAAKARPKSNNIRIQQIDVIDTSTSTDDLILSEEWDHIHNRLRAYPVSYSRADDLRSPTPSVPTPLINVVSSQSNIDLRSQNTSPPPSPKNIPGYSESVSPDSRPITGATNKSSSEVEYSKISITLNQSENPIFELFLRYGPIMNNEWNARLLRAAAMEASMQAPKVVRRVFDYVIQEIKNIEVDGQEGLHDIILCEKSITQLAELKRTGNTKHSLFRESIHELYKLFGILQAKSVLLDFRLGEYRSLFESLSIVKTNVDLASCEEFKKCYGAFLTTQGVAIELSNRLMALKEACNEYGLNENLDLHLPPLATDPNTTNGDVVSHGAMSQKLHTDMSVSGFEVVPSRDTTGNVPVYNNLPSQESNSTYNQQLQRDLDEALEEIDDLRTEMFAIEQQKDRTPGALLFFAGLFDPNAIHAIANLIENMKNLQGIAMCKEHVDFLDLRQRILVCLTNLPPMERLLFKFNKMHSKWTKSRYDVFSSRDQAGGDADATLTCPLCAQDGRSVPLSPLPGSPTKSSNNVNMNESTPDFTVSSKMVVNPFAKTTTKSRMSPSKGHTKALLLDELSSPLSNSSKSSPTKKGGNKVPPNTPPLRLDSPATFTTSIGGNLEQGLNEDLHRKAVLNRVKTKNW